MQAVRTVPDSLMSSVDGVVDGLSRVLQVKTAREETGKVSASIDTEVIMFAVYKMLLIYISIKYIISPKYNSFIFTL